MGFRARWTEEQFEEWFHGRFDQWINGRLGAELDQRLRERDAAADGQFQGRFDALFKARFEAGLRDQIKTWQDDGMPGVDTWVNNFFDNLFTVYADTWGDSINFQQRFDERFDERFKERFEERLESEVRARVANELADRIDKRIEQWLVEVRQQILDAAESSAGQPSDATAERERPDGAPVREAALTATAAQLAEYLAKKPVGHQQIRRLLKGKEIPGQRPATYPLDEAASALLLRKGRRAKKGQDGTEP